MKTHRTLLWIGGAIASASAALALGVPVATLLLVAAVLACPVTMYFGMRGMHRDASGMACHPGTSDHSPSGLPTNTETSELPISRESAQS